MPLQWNGKVIEDKVRQKLVKRLEAAAIVVQNECKTLLVQHDNITGESPSKPGQPPAKETGRLSSSISREVDEEKLVARVGSNVLYAKFLELGTSRMAARPWLRPALTNSMAAIKRIFGMK